MYGCWSEIHKLLFILNKLAGLRDLHRYHIGTYCGYMRWNCSIQTDLTNLLSFVHEKYLVDILDTLLVVFPFSQKTNLIIYSRKYWHFKTIENE